MEYYRGILILTTNLVNVVDEAFQSRINIALEFPELDTAARRKVWETFINRMDQDIVADVDDLIDCAHDWAKKDLSARQIRNIISTTELLAVGRGRGAKVEREDIDNVLRNTMAFSRTNARIKGQAKPVFRKSSGRLINEY